MKKGIITAILAALGDVLVLYIFHLSGWPAICLFLISGLCAPLSIKTSRKRQLWKEEFYDLSAFMEQFLCSYKRWGHMKMAFKDCMDIFEKESRICSLIQRAIAVLETGEGEEGTSIYVSAFNEFTSIYKCRRLDIMSQFFCQIEQKGANVEAAVEILFADFQMWKQRILRYQKKKINLEKEFILATVLAMLLCCATPIIMPAHVLGQLKEMTVYQVSTAVVFLLFTVLGMLIFCSFSKSWLDDSMNDEDAIEQEFPYWLLSVSLYLQSDSVYHAIQQSCYHLKGRFAKEVSKLLAEIYEMPNSLEPYINFFREEALPELHTGMKILYAVNSNGYEEAQKRVRFLIEQNHRLMDESETNRYQRSLSLFQLIKQTPLMIAGAKIVFDAIIFVLLIGKDAMLL